MTEETVSALQPASALPLAPVAKKAAKKKLFPPAAKKKAAPKKAAKKKAAKKKAAKKKGTGAGRISQFAGKKIIKLVSVNPRRNGTAGFKSFDLLRNGMSYEKYIEEGGRRVDLAYDLEHKYVALQ
jgi:hypothetical protein